MPDDTQILLAWERGYQALPVERALLLAALAMPQRSLDTLLSLSIGQRDWILLQLRQKFFGNRIESVTDCPVCKQSLELTFNLTDVLVDQSGAERIQGQLECDGYNIEYRCPTSD